MSIMYCDYHGHYDTDWHPEGCPVCIERAALVTEDEEEGDD